MTLLDLFVLGVVVSGVTATCLYAFHKWRWPEHYLWCQLCATFWTSVLVTASYAFVVGSVQVELLAIPFFATGLAVPLAKFVLYD
jgi:hypothetical protein